MGMIVRLRTVLLLLVLMGGAAKAEGAPGGKGFACDGERRVCTCAGAPEEKPCKQMSENCMQPMRCGAGGCECAYAPEFLGGPRKR